MSERTTGPLFDYESTQDAIRIQYHLREEGLSDVPFSAILRTVRVIHMEEPPAPAVLEVLSYYHRLSVDKMNGFHPPILPQLSPDTISNSPNQTLTGKNSLQQK